MCTVAAVSGAASIPFWYLMSRGWDPWTRRAPPEDANVSCVPGLQRHAWGHRWEENLAP